MTLALEYAEAEASALRKPQSAGHIVATRRKPQSAGHIVATRGKPQSAGHIVTTRTNARTAMTRDTQRVPAGSANTSSELPEFGLLISGASSGAISVDQLPPPIPAGIATYCRPFARYVMGN